MKRPSVTRLVVLLALGLVIIEWKWVREAAYFLWIHFYWLVSKLWRF